MDNDALSRLCADTIERIREGRRLWSHDMLGLAEATQHLIAENDRLRTISAGTGMAKVGDIARGRLARSPSRAEADTLHKIIAAAEGKA